MPLATPTPASTRHDGLEFPDILPYIAADSLVEVSTDDLVVRSLPEISDRSVIHSTLLQAGEQLYVLEGPVSADGHGWYRVMPTDPGARQPPLPVIGWVAAGYPPEPWIVPWTAECPVAELDGILRARSLLLLACFGDQELVLEGVMQPCSYVVPGTVSPAWLWTEFCELVPFDAMETWRLGDPALGVHLQPAVTALRPDAATPVRVRGHFDDPAAATCVQTYAVDAEPTPPDLVILWCRTSFVAVDIVKIEATR